MFQILMNFMQKMGKLKFMGKINGYCTENDSEFGEKKINSVQ